jgi:iron complex outermembrane recepter protein
MQFPTVKGLALMAGLILVAFGKLSFAEDENPTAADQSGALQEIIVTARRQNENLERTPVAVDFLSNTTLSEQHVTSEQDLQTAVPGLLGMNASSSAQLSFALRGQSIGQASYTSPTVLVYFNELQTSGLATTTFFDLQSVQVLKGPQGTLFGRNSTGGAVLYTTTQPGKEFDGYVVYTAGNFNEQKLEGAVTIPLVEWASLRLAAVDEHRDGYEHNIYLNTDAGSVDNQYFRGTLLLTPLDALESVTTIQYGKQGGDSAAFKIANANTTCPPSPNCTAAQLYPPGVPTGGMYPAKLASYNGILNFIAMEGKQPFWNVWSTVDDAHAAQLKVLVNSTTFKLNDDLSIKNIVGYDQEIARDGAQPANAANGSPFQIATNGPGSGIINTSEQYSDELRLAGTALNKRLDYQVGVFYDRDNEGINDALNEGCGSFAFPVTPANPGGCAIPGRGIAYNFETDEESRAVFGQLNFEIIDNLRATAGFRETWEDISLRYIDDGSPEDLYQLEGVPLPPVSSEHEPSWTLGLDYQLTPETLLYIAQRGGFRVGGFNGLSVIATSAGTRSDSFKPEIARDLELGIKYAGRLGVVPVRINADVYEERVRDAQEVVFSGLASVTTNANKTQTDGFELNAQIDLTSWLQAGLNYAFTDARFTDGTSHYTQVDPVSGAILDRTVILGPDANAPRNTGSFYVRVAHDLPNSLGQLVVRQDIYSQSYFYDTSLAGSVLIPYNGIGPLDPNSRIGGYTLLNARVEWNRIAGSKFNAAAYVRNMLNKQYEAGGLGFAPVLGIDNVLLGTPRMAGLEVGFKF